MIIVNNLLNMHKQKYAKNQNNNYANGYILKYLFYSAPKIYILRNVF